MEESLAAYLLASAGLAALVAARIYWVRNPQAGANPHVLLTRISGVRDTTFKGASGIVESRVQADCYGLTYASAKGVARAVEARLSGVKATQGSTIFDGCFLVGERDTFEDAATPDKLFRTSLDFMIWHKGA